MEKLYSFNKLKCQHRVNSALQKTYSGTYQIVVAKWLLNMVPTPPKKKAAMTCHIISYGKKFKIHTTEDFKENKIQEAMEW